MYIPPAQQPHHRDDDGNYHYDATIDITPSLVNYVRYSALELKHLLVSAKDNRLVTRARLMEYHCSLIEVGIMQHLERMMEAESRARPPSSLTWK
jgi:hypothetical protein